MTTVPFDPNDLHDADRLYLSRLSPGPVFVRALGPLGTPVAADGAVTITLVPDWPEGPSSEPLEASVAAGMDPVTYAAALPSAMTSTPGPYTVRWDYTTDGVARYGEMPILIGGTAPAYDSLSWDMKAVVEAVWLRVADQFDSPLGGPHLAVYMQSNFGRNRIAQLLPKALGRMNTLSQPHQTYDTLNFPLAQWGSLLELALWVETIKHLRRSYLEQPDPVGVTVARLDRRNYSALWGEILRDEEGDLRAMLDHFKMSHMGLGSGSVLVSGGIYPRLAPSVQPVVGMAAARGFYLWR